MMELLNSTSLTPSANAKANHSSTNIASLRRVFALLVRRTSISYSTWNAKTKECMVSELLWMVTQCLARKPLKVSVVYKVSQHPMAILVASNFRSPNSVKRMIGFLRGTCIDHLGILLWMITETIQEVQERSLLKSMILSRRKTRVVEVEVVEALQDNHKILFSRKSHSMKANRVRISV